MVSASNERILVTAILFGGWLRVRFFCSFFRCFTGLIADSKGISTGDRSVGVEIIDMTGGRRLAKVGTLGSAFRDLRMLGRYRRSDDIVGVSDAGD